MQQTQVRASTVSVVQLLDFLQEGFASGLAPNTLCRQVAALSSILTCASSTPLSKEPLIQSFLRGATNLRPPVVHRFPTWDLTKVLTALTRPPFEPLREVNLKFLFFKVSFLVAITSAHRIPELASVCTLGPLCLPQGQGSAPPGSRLHSEGQLHLSQILGAHTSQFLSLSSPLVEEGLAHTGHPQGSQNLSHPHFLLLENRGPLHLIPAFIHGFPDHCHHRRTMAVGHYLYSL